MIISTKIHIPHVRHKLVNRPRMMELLDKGMNAKLTLISAQAGYGKTTSLSEWIKQRSIPAAWLSLDEQDNDVLRFWQYVTAAIEEQVPNFGQNIWHIIGNVESVDMKSVVIAIINELNKQTVELVLIFDDYHLIKLSTIDELLYYFITYLPAHVHVYIASRATLRMSTAGLRAKGYYYQIDEQQLRFLLDEGKIFFQEYTDLSLTDEQVNHLHQHTEGWISGLKLAAMSLENSENWNESILQLSGQQYQIADYLLEEVFRHQSESMQEFLLQTSILRRMNYELCEEITGKLDGQFKLEQLEKLKMFIFPLDEYRKWYRYHHLFSEFLQRVFIKTDPEKYVQAHIKAAKWFEKNGFDDEAVEHYIAGKEYEEVLRLMQKNLLDLIHSKREAANRWILMLPESLFVKQPMTELLYIASLLSMEKWSEAIQRVKQAEMNFRALKGSIPDVEWNEAMGGIAAIGSLVSLLQKDLVKTGEYFELIEQYAPNGTFFQHNMWRNRYSGYDSVDDYLALQSDIYAVEELLLKAIRLWGDKEYYPVVGYHFASYSKLQYEWNDLESAELLANRALQREDMKPHVRVIIHNTIIKAKILAAKGNLERAMALLEQLKVQIESPDIELFHSKIAAEQASLSIRTGSIVFARQWLETCGMTSHDAMSRFKILEYQVFARVLTECGRMEEALSLLERLYVFVTQQDRLYDRVKVLILQSIALYRLNRLEDAMVKLEEALKLSEPMNYIRRYTDEGFVMVELLSAYVTVKKAGRLEKNATTIDYAKKLLQAMDITEEEIMVKDILTEQEMRVIQLLGEGLTNKEIAYHLNISSETVKSHMKNIYRKLNVNNRVQAIQYSKELHLIG